MSLTTVSTQKGSIGGMLIILLYYNVAYDKIE